VSLGKRYNQKTHINVIFHPFVQKLPVDGYVTNLVYGSLRRLMNSAKFYCSLFCSGSNFTIPTDLGCGHSVTQCWCYHAACDIIKSNLPSCNSKLYISATEKVLAF